VLREQRRVLLTAHPPIRRFWSTKVGSPPRPRPRAPHAHRAPRREHATQTTPSPAPTHTQDPGQSVFNFKIGLKQVIPAWDEGVLTMQVGETSRITATAEVAYGATGFPAWGIPPNATLLFDIELLKVE